jgi:hypothetical protein
MTIAEKELLGGLLELEKAVQCKPTVHPKPDILPLLMRIDELAAALPRDADPTLLHYLQRKSYEKARRFLEGREKETEAGLCRH